MPSEFKVLLRNRKFVYLWSSQILSQLAIQIMNFLVIVKLFERTGSTIATSFIWVAYALPAIMIGPFAAAWVDFIDRRMALIVSNLFQFLTLLAYSILFNRYFFLSYAVVMVYSLFNQLYVPAEAASLPSIVSKKSLSQANGLFFLTQQAAIVFGFGTAGLLNEFLGFRFSFLLLSALLFVAFLSVSFLPTMQAGSNTKKLDKGVGEFFEKIAEGYQFIKNNPSILLPFLLLAGMHVAVSIISVNLPVMAKDIISINPNLAGLAIVFPAGIGALSAILLIPRYLKRIRKKDLIEKSLIAISLGLWLTIFVVPEMVSYLRPFVTSFFFLIVGFAFAGIVVPAQTYLQEHTPKDLMGRVFGNFWFIATIATIFPVLFSATISEVFGVRMLFFLIGLTTLIAYVYSTKRGQRVLEQEHA